MKTIFITGGTGYLGARLIKRLLKRGHRVLALVRAGSASKLPPGAEVIIGNALDGDSFRDKIPAGCTFIHLVGVSHPGPSKAELFRTIDLASIQASAKAIQGLGIEQFIYVSVAQTPSGVMAEYQKCRAEGERLLLASPDIQSLTILRPWYVLGPGHWWPVLLLPFYAFAKLAGRSIGAKARAFGLVWLHQMLRALEFAVETSPTHTPRILEINDIRHPHA